jgi:uroporphyrinogen-III synthase
MKSLLVLRPAPAAAATLARAVAAGFNAVSAPLFTVVPQAWDAPDPADHDAVMLTSANAVRLAGPQLARFTHLPAYAVGEATAVAALSAGFAKVHAGTTGVVALIAQMAAAGIARPLHLAGREFRAPGDPPMPIVRRVVYAADPVPGLPRAARAALERGAVALVHSPRAAIVLAELVARAGLDRQDLRVAAISTAAACDWLGAAIADVPTDDALLAAAARLCEKG